MVGSRPPMNDPFIVNALILTGTVITVGGVGCWDVIKDTKMPDTGTVYRMNLDRSTLVLNVSKTDTHFQIPFNFHYVCQLDEKKI